MSGLRDLLRFCYRSVEDALLAPGVPDQAPDLPDSAVDDEEIQNKENEKAFLTFEVRVASRSDGIHDFEGQIAATSGVVKDLVTEQLNFFNDQLLRARRSQPSLSGNQSDSTQQDPTQRDYEAVRDYANYVNENGQLDDRLEDALALSVRSECPALVAKVTRLNVSLEQLHEKEDIAAEKTVSKTGSTTAARRNRTQIDHRELLYELLHNRTECAGEEHLAILPLSRLDDNDLHMFLSVCPQAGEKAANCQWHETKFLFCRNHSRDKGVNKPANLFNLCQNVRRYSKYHRRLFLHFDGSTLQEKPETGQAHDFKLQKPNPVNLRTILQGNGLREETGEIRMKKSLLALQLASALHLLYPGPWIQQNWDASSVLILGDERDDNADHNLNRAYVRCKLVSDWKTTNPTWQEFDRSQQDTPYFLLAFAQLLVDISEGQLGARPEEPTEGWCDALFDKAEKLLGDKCLSYYGAAIQGCLQYAIDYGHERQCGKDPKQSARSVIQRKIVKNLQKNFGVWKSQWDGQSPSPGHHGSGNAAEAGRVTRLPSTATEQTRISQNAATPWPSEHTHSFSAPDRAEAPRSFYTLFTDEDGKAEEMKPGHNYKSEFLDLMDNFYRQYICPLPRQDTPRPIRIAVLDTGLRVDDGDGLLYRGSKRVLAISGNFLEAKYKAGGYFDNHGHGTHVVRLLLRLAPRAQIVVVKVSEDQSFASTKLEQIVEALKWAAFEANADIINISFGLDEAAKDKIQPVINCIVESGKLIFAAASNSGGNGKRAYPAKGRGVFAIHATNDDGSSPTDLNPPRDEFMDNFATLGCRIPSCWDGRDVFITGTSFATPVAVAIAANILELVQQAQDKSQGNPRYFFVYKGMRRLLSGMSSRKGDYDYVRPWKDDMFDDDTHDAKDMLKKLQEMSIYR